MALKCNCGGDIRKTIDNKDECIICGNDESNTIKGDDKMAKEHDFKIEKISGTATVTDGGRVYDIYVTFAKAAGYLEAVNHGKRLTAGDKVVIMAIGNHEYETFGKIYVVESNDGVRHLIGEKGLTDIRLDEPTQIPEQTYVEIAEPFGKQFRDAIREAYARGYADGKRIGEMMREESPQEKVCDVQRQRDRIVEQAKQDIEELKNEYDGLYDVKNTPLHPYACSADFIVNKEKRTVVALLRGTASGIIRAKGIAKCVPGDCFNVHIGKAIALRKALGKNIDDYMNVPNPTEVRVGDIVTWEYPNHTYVIEPGMRVISLQDGWDYTEYANIKKAKIIDDSREVSE